MPDCVPDCDRVCACTRRRDATYHCLKMCRLAGTHDAHCMQLALCTGMRSTVERGRTSEAEAMDIRPMRRSMVMPCRTPLAISPVGLAPAV